MKRCLSVLLSLTGVLLLMAAISACKPETRNSPSQQAGTATVQPVLTATVVSAASTVAISSTLSKPPACQFKSTALAATLPATASYTFSEPRVVYTRTGSGILSIYGWLPDSNQLMINDYDENIHRYTIEVLDVQTGKTHRYVERQSPGWIGWLPQQQALAYVDSEPAQGIVRRDLWISRGDPQQAARVASGVNDEAIAIDTAGRLAFFTQERSNQPSGSQLQRLDVATQAKQATSLDLAQWELPRYTRPNEPADLQSRQLRSTWRPGTGSQVLFYGAGSGVVLADTQTGQLCEIEIRQQGKPFVATHAVWSPDGRYLAALVEAVGTEGRLLTSFLIIDMDTGQQFVPDLDAHTPVGAPVIDMEWGANSRNLIALTKVLLSYTPGDVKHELYAIDVLAQTTQQVLPDAKLGGGAGGPGEMSWSPDGRQLAINCPTWPVGGNITGDHVCLISISKIP